MTFSRLRVLAFFVAVLLTIVSRQDTTFADNPTNTPNLTPTYASVPVTLNVTGAVTSGTAGVPVPPGIPITLHVAHNDPKTGNPTEVVKRDTALTADKTFSFENISVLPGDLAFVTTAFQGIIQGSAPVKIANDQTRLNTPLTLYAVTTDPSVITLLQVEHILDFKAGIVQVLATYHYKNLGDRLYLSKDRAANGLPVSVHVPLPIGAQAIAFNSPTTSRFSIGGDANAPVVQDTKPVVPGQSDQIVFSYQMSYSSGTPIDQDYPYNTSSLQVLIPDDSNVSISGVKINANKPDDSLMDRSANTTINPKRSYTAYSLKTPLKAGDRLVYFLGQGQPVTTAPSSAASSSQSSLGKLAVIAIFILLVGVVGVFAFLRVGRRK